MLEEQLNALCQDIPYNYDDTMKDFDRMIHQSLFNRFYHWLREDRIYGKGINEESHEEIF